MKTAFANRLTNLFTASCSDFVQGCKEIELGCKGDTQTPTNNDLSELLYDGNDGIYHTSTIGASLISMVGGNLVNKKAASVAKKESEKIAKKAAMQPADVVESGTDVIQSKFNKLLDSDY